MRENESINLKLIYIEADDKDRLLRQLNREYDPDCHEIVRRFGADEQDFAEEIIDFLSPDLFILNNKYLALIISILLVIATTKRRHLIIVSLISVLLSIINLLYPHLLWIIKICFLIIYLAFLSDIVDVASVKKLYEVSLYKYKNRFIDRFLLLYKRLVRREK